MGSRPANANGFSLDHHEPTPAGEWSFVVDHPWYSSTRDVAAGLTFDYSHDPLVFGMRGANNQFQQQGTAVEHQLVLHVDVAASLLDRLTLALSLPIVLFERGHNIDSFEPLSGGSAGDVRLGIMLRILGQPDADAFSLSFGTALWIPVGTNNDHAGDSSVRVMPKLVAGGLAKRIRWSATLSYLARELATLDGSGSDVAGSSVGPEVQLGAAIAYADLKHHFAVGPEALMATSVIDSHHFFKKTYTSFEVLLGGHYNIRGQVQIGAAVGFGLLREPGTPDYRFLLRAAYAPYPKRRPTMVRDEDRDGIPDSVDGCPATRGLLSDDPSRNGCPAEVSQK